MATEPTVNTNTGDLEGKACPECGQFEQFDVDGSTTLSVCDDETDASGVFYGEFEWADNARAFCRECQWHGPVADLVVALVQHCASPEGLREQAARASLMDKLTPFGAVGHATDLATVAEANGVDAATRAAATGRRAREATIRVGGAWGEVSISQDGAHVGLTLEGLTPAQLLDALTAVDTGALAAVVAALTASPAA